MGMGDGVRSVRVLGKVLQLVIGDQRSFFFLILKLCIYVTSSEECNGFFSLSHSAIHKKTPHTFLLFQLC